ncbi:MAG TPA: serine/threonine-protein kinase [Gemmataceae bacterium]|nr:serine/threonine-protein kinase [Gemmataceae bacterium]
MNREAFLERLRESRLLAAEQLQLAADLVGAWSKAAPQHCESTSYAEILTAEGLLTPFQAQMLLKEEPGRLVLGQYHLLDELGRGGMGQVFKARHAVMDRIVALKVLWPPSEEHDFAQGWFEREVRMLTQLQHPNIVLAYDANEVDGVRYLAMEYVEGQTLQSLVHQGEPLSIPLACTMMAEAATALQYAHEKGLVHRDIKPANLLVPVGAFAEKDVPHDGAPRPPAPRIKIVDFGLARLRTPTNADTIVLQSPDQFAGTPDYVSPEQCRDVHAVDIRSDLYSLGCTFFFALTGRPPFGGQTALEKLTRHITEPPPPLTRLRPDAPAAVEEIILRLMAKEPDERFQTPAALARALRPLCSAADAAPQPVARDLPAQLAPLHAEASGTVMSARDGGARNEIKSVAYRDWLEKSDAGNEAVEQPPVVADSHEPAPAAVAKSGPPAAQRTPPEANSDGVSIDHLLRDALPLWIEAVASIYHRQGRGKWNEDEYRRLHEGLLAVCRRGESGPAERRLWFRRLRELVQPWVSLDSLERTEPELLGSLLAQCRRMERALGVHRPLHGLGRWLRRAAAAVLIIWLLIQGSAAVWRLLSVEARGVNGLNFSSVCHSLQLDAVPGQVYVLLPLIVLMAVLLVRK